MRVSGVRVGGLALFAAGALLVGRAEATSRIFDLSPENDEAAAVGSLTAYLEGQGGKGSIWLKLPSGEIETGQFEVKRGGSVGELGKAYGIDSRGAAYTGYGEEIIMHGSPGVIDMASPKGATVHCEVINDDAQDHGSGVCRFSNGAVYRVLY